MKLLLTIPFTIYIWISIGYYSKAFCQSISSYNANEICFSKRSQYLDYSKFVLNNADSDEFNTTQTNNPVKYLQLNKWLIDFGNIPIDSFSQSTLKLTGKELEINVENWKLENNIPQFLIGSIQRNVTNVLGLYEWRVKFDDFYSLAALSSISNKESFHYTPIDYMGNSPYELFTDSWHYFPINDVSQSIPNYYPFQCEDSSKQISVPEKLGHKIASENFIKHYKGKQKYYQYDCKACNCRQSILFDTPIHEQYQTLSLVLTTEYSAFFVNGVLMYVNTLGGNDSTSICPLSEAECTKNSTLSLSSAVIQNDAGTNFETRNDLWNYLLTGNEVKWTIDYFRKYDFDSNHLSSQNYLQSYKREISDIHSTEKISKKITQTKFISDSLLLLVSQKNELTTINNNNISKTIIDKKTNETIKIGGDFVISPDKNIFFVNTLGYIEMLRRDSLGNYHKETLLQPNTIQRVKNTSFKDIALLENQGETEIIFKTRKNNIGRYFKNRGRWYFIEMTSKSSIRIEGDILTGTNGKIFYRGNDGYLHGMQVKGKKRQSFHINLRPLGSKTPKIAKTVGSFAITDQDEIIYVSTDNHLIHLHLVNRRYKIKELSKKSKLNCKQIAGGLIWVNMPKMQQLLFFDKSNQLCGLQYNPKNQTWNLDIISSTTKTFTQLSFKKIYSIDYSNSQIIYRNHKNQLITYQLIPSSIQINNDNYAHYIDNKNECLKIKAKRILTFDLSNRRLSDY